MNASPPPLPLGEKTGDEVEVVLVHSFFHVPLTPQAARPRQRLHHDCRQCLPGSVPCVPRSRIPPSARHPLSRMRPHVAGALLRAPPSIGSASSRAWAAPPRGPLRPRTVTDQLRHRRSQVRCREGECAARGGAAQRRKRERKTTANLTHLSHHPLDLITSPAARARRRARQLHPAAAGAIAAVPSHPGRRSRRPFFGA